MYALRNSLRTDASFIHELVHHLMTVKGLGHTEDEQKMLAVMKEYLPESWITERFAARISARPHSDLSWVLNSSPSLTVQGKR